MIRLGVCTNPENIDVIAKAGYDFCECGFAWLHGLEEADYQALVEQVRKAPIGVEACNGMLPGDLKVTGPNVDERAIRAYLEKAFARAQALGVKVVVFGSGAARNVPEGFPHEEAWRQIANYLTIANEYGEKYGIDIAIEPLRRAECNIMNLVTEGTLMAALLRLPHVGVLGDTHHMVCGGEPFDALTQAGKLLKHVHVSHSMGNEGGRDFPSAGDGCDYGEIFRALEAGGYEGRVSIEASCSDLSQDAENAYKVLTAARG